MVVYSVCCSDCGARVEVQTYAGLERVLCDRCKKVEDQREVLDQVDCGNCKSRVCERGEK